MVQIAACSRLVTGDCEDASRCLTFRSTPIGFAISDSRLIVADRKRVIFEVKDCRIDGPERYKTMTPDA
jgi:hypothetical protein